MDRTRVELAEDALGVGDAEGAIALLDAHLARHPEDADAKALRESARQMALDAAGAREEIGGLRPDARHLDGPGRAPVAERPATPWGVAILAALHFVVALGLALLAFAGLLMSPGVGLLLGLATVPLFGLAVGLWRLRRWAWVILLVLHGVGAFVAAAAIARGERGALVGLALNVAVVAYLLHVSRAFGPPRGSPAGAHPTPARR